MEIRPYVDSDAAATLTVFISAVTETPPTHYSPEQIEAWSWPHGRDLISWSRARRSPQTFVATTKGELAGSSDIDSAGHIDMMFVAPEFGRLGVASALLLHLRQSVPTGITQLSTTASITARPFFEQHRFTSVHEQRTPSTGQN